MTKEITKAIILQEIADKFKLRELEPEKFSFSEQVVPVYEISGHLGVYEIIYIPYVVTSIGGKILFNVPMHEQWTLNGYDIIFMGAGAYTVSGVFIVREDASSFHYLDLTAGQTVSYTVNLPKPVVLKSGNSIGVFIDGYTSQENIRLYIDVMKEEVR